MKHQQNSTGVRLSMAALSLTALMLTGCSHSAPPPPTPPPSDQVTTKNMRPDDAVKAHMNQMQQNGGGK